MSDPARRRRGPRQGISTTSLYGIWSGMIQRCANPKRDSYQYYGARGIRVCDRWLHSFANFMADVGPRPSTKHSIDRINNDGNYEPGNCRWATPLEQSHNSPRVHLVEFRGRKYSRTELAELLGISYWTLRTRLDRGVPVEDAVALESLRWKGQPIRISGTAEQDQVEEAIGADRAASKARTA